MNLLCMLHLLVLGLSLSSLAGWAQSTPSSQPSTTTSPWTTVTTRPQPVPLQPPGPADTITPAWTAGPTPRTTTIRNFLAASSTYALLVQALESTDLLNRLDQTETYTLFAPSNSAFRKLPPDFQESLLADRNRKALAHLLGCHLLTGGLDTIELRQQIKAGRGVAYLSTVAGETLTARFGYNWQIVLTDPSGRKAIIDRPDRLQQNGIVHGIDTVLRPATGIFGR